MTEFNPHAAGALKSTFEVSRQEVTGETLEQIRQNYFIALNMSGSDETSFGGLNVNRGDRQDNTSRAKQKEKQDAQHFFILSLLEQMKNQLNQLEAQMAQRFEVLKEKYGEDVIGGMSSTYLSEDELTGLETDEQKLEALANKFLDENGHIKDEYKDLEEAKYVRDWQQAQILKPIVAKYEGRDTLSRAEQQEVLETAENTGLADNKNKMVLSDNSELQNTIDKHVDQSAEQLQSVKMTSTLNFS